jgi:hypothetical protein
MEAAVLAPPPGDRRPVWRDWLADGAARPRRAPVIERMRHAGVLDLPGALDGW